MTEAQADQLIQLVEFIAWAGVSAIGFAIGVLVMLVLMRSVSRTWQSL